jgi:hypothetical protein
MNNEEPKPVSDGSDEDPQEEIEAAETEARKRAIESEQKEVVVFPESTERGRSVN